jgi:hypothetical protein
MERDDDIGNLYDQGQREDDAFADWRATEPAEREEMLEAALTECLQKGVSREHLKTLVFETGATSWGLKNSLKTPEPKRPLLWPID